MVSHKMPSHWLTCSGHLLYNIGVTIATKQPIKTPLTLALRELCDPHFLLWNCDKHTGEGYPASTSFLLRQTRENPLRATVYFSIERARVRQAARDAFDVNFIFFITSVRGLLS